MGAKTRKLGNSQGLDVQWQAPLNADGSTVYNLKAGEGYFLNTTGGVIEVVLPASPTLGDTISIVDYAGTFNTNNCIINTSNKFVYSLMIAMYRLCEPSLKLVRRYIPSFGNIDISPIIVYLGLWFIKSLLIEYWPR